MRTVPITLTVLLTLGCTAAAQTITGGANAASYIADGLPNGGLAQGGIATFFVDGLGINTLARASSFPLEETLDGVSVTVTSGGMSYPALPIVQAPTGGTSAQVSGIIRSETPVGPATVVISKDGLSTPPFAVTIVAHAPGIFALNQGGSGPGIFTDPLNSFALNLITAAYIPGAWADIWATGLGAVSGDDTVPQPGDLQGVYDIQVYVGGLQVQVLYAGRGGSDAGVDQIRIVLPANIVGCYVPVVIVVNGVAGNTVTISVSDQGGACTDPYGLSPEDIIQGQQAGGLNIGTISLSRNRLRSPNPLGGGFFSRTTDSGSATFERFADSQLFSVQSLSGYFTPGSCIVHQFEGSDAEDAPDDPTELDPVEPVQFLDAGLAINLMHGVNGNRSMAMQTLGNYFSTLGGDGFGAQQPLYLSSGNYTFNNGTGGSDIGAFTASGSFPDPLTWTNRDDLMSMLEGPLLITWTGGQGMAVIFGFSIDTSENGAGFLCLANGAAGQFSVPAWVINSLPPTAVVAGFPTGMLSVGNAADTVEFDAPNLDVGLINYSSADLQAVGYHVVVPDPGSGGGNGGGGEAFELSSTSFPGGGVIPGKHGAGGACGFANVSPQFSWGTVPEGTQTVALVMDDPDAGGFVHWAVWDIPATEAGLPEGNPQNLGTAATNDFGLLGYGGPCPPPGQTHTYRIRAFAVPTNVGIPEGTPASTLVPLLNQFGTLALASDTYTGTFP